MATVRRGFALIELVVSLALLLLVLPLGLQGYGAFLRALERELQRVESQEALTAFFAFLETPLSHVGLGLPEQWSSDLFKLSGISLPDWGSWGNDIAVGNSTGSSSFRVVSDGEWGDSLRVLSAVPVDSAVIKELYLSPNVASELRLLGQWSVSSQNMGVHRPVQWLLFPPEETPVFFRSWSLSSTGNSGEYTVFAEVLASQPAIFSWGMKGFHLFPLTLRCQNDIVYGNFHDQSGDQPLIAGINSVSFSLDRDKRLLRVRAEAPSREEERIWFLPN